MRQESQPTTFLLETDTISLPIIVHKLKLEKLNYLL